MTENFVNVNLFWFLMATLAIGAVMLFMWLYPIYNVWASQKAGDAALAESHGEQRVQVAQARARLEAAELNKKAVVIEAEAEAKSLKTIGDALKNNPGYLQWQWIKMMENRDSRADTIYVPTECGLPLLEAGKRKK